MAAAMGRLLVGLLLAGSLAVGLWLWASSGERNAGAAGAARAEEPALRPRSGALETSDEIQAPALFAPAAEQEAAPAPVEQADQRRALPASVKQKDDLLVKVVDPAGRPIPGIPLRLDPGSNDSSLGPSERRALERSGVAHTTDSGGRVVFAGLRPILAAAAEPWTLWHELPFEEPPALLLDRATLAADEVVFVLPYGGSIEVVVRALDGTPAPDDTLIELALTRDGERQEPDWTQRTHEGRVLYPWVELARIFEVRAWQPQSTVPSRSRARGPWTLGERAVIEVVLGADHPIVSFRALNSGGSPLARVELELVRKHFSFLHLATRVETDERGRFTVDEEGRFFSGGSFVVRYRPAPETELCGRAEIPGGLQAGWNDGGDVILTSPPVLAAGWVVSDSGAPVAGAKVEAASDVDGDFGDRFGGGDRGKVTGESDAQGRFELRGLLAETEFELRAEQDSLRSQTVRVHEGERAARLVLSSQWIVSGTLLLDPELDSPSIRLRLQEAGQDPIEAQLSGPREDRDDSRFTLTRVPTGAYELTVDLDDVRFAKLEGIVVRADTDVGTIDLRGRMQRCEIVLLGAEETELVTGKVSWRPSDSDGDWQSRNFQGSLIQLVAASLPIDVWVEPGGYRRALLERVSGRRELVLQAPLQARLVLHTDGAFPELPYELRCDLMLGSDDVAEAQGARHFSDENRELVFLVFEPGKLRLRWILEKAMEQRVQFEEGTFTSSGTIASEVLHGHELEIEVLDVPGEQVFPIELDGDALSALTRDPPW